MATVTIHSSYSLKYLSSYGVTSVRVASLSCDSTVNILKIRDKKVDPDFLYRIVAMMAAVAAVAAAVVPDNTINPFGKSNRVRDDVTILLYASIPCRTIIANGFVIVAVVFILHRSLCV